MSDRNDEPETRQAKSTAPMSRVLIAVATVAVVFGICLYAFSNLFGKSEGTKNAALGGCNFSAENRARLDAAAKGEVAAFKLVDEPSSVATLTFVNRHGETVTMENWKGRTVLLNLWATWCAPCREEMPSLETLETERGGKNFQVLPVSLDLGDDSKPKAFYSETNLKILPFYHDGTLETLTTLKKRGLAYGLPASLLIDHRSCVLGVLNGPANWAGADASGLIATAVELNKL